MKLVLLQPGYEQKIRVCVVKEYSNGLFTVVDVGGKRDEIGTTVSHTPCSVVCLRIICSLHLPVYTSAPLGVLVNHWCARESLGVLVNTLCARESFVCS